MINGQIIEFIKRQLAAGDSQQKIRSDLLANGWTDADINEAMVSSSAPQNVPVMGQMAPIKSSKKIIPITISIVVLLILVGGTVFMMYKPDSAQKINTETIAENNSNEAIFVDDIDKTNDSANSVNATETTPNPLPNKNEPVASNDLWTVYEKFVLALKNEDVSAYNAISYSKILPDEESYFSQLASFLYDQSIQINRSEFVNQWQDEKQAIYSTNPKKMDDAQSYKYEQGSLFFINKAGEWKLLSIVPGQVWSVIKSGTNQTAAQIDKQLQLMMLDSDKDGLTDMRETCTGASEFDPKCVKTDPNKRDTNGNGWWDGIEAKMNK